MQTRRTWAALAAGWTFLALLTATLSLPGRAEALQAPLAYMTVVGVCAAAGAALMVRAGRRYAAGMLLILSAFTPTGFVLLNGGILIAGFVVAVRAMRPVSVARG